MIEKDREILCKQLNGVYVSGNCLQKVTPFEEPYIVKRSVFILTFIITLMLSLYIILYNYLSIWYDEPYIMLFDYASGDFVWYRWFNLLGIPYSTIILYNDPMLWWTIFGITMAVYFVIIYILVMIFRKMWFSEKIELMK